MQDNCASSIASFKNFLDTKNPVEQIKAKEKSNGIVEKENLKVPIVCDKSAKQLEILKFFDRFKLPKMKFQPPENV